MQIVRRTCFLILVFVFLAGALEVSAQSSPLQFVAVAPCRVADTRNTGTPIQGGTSQNFAVQGTCGIPVSAAAYSLNVTVVPRGPLNYLTVWPAGETQPVVSTLNSVDGRIKANAAIVGAGSSDGGAVSVYATNTTDVVLDIDGYFTPSNSSSLAFYPVTPCRVADTRNGQVLPGGQEADFPVSGLCNIPASATGYSLNVTALPREPLGYLTVWPAGQTQPYVSTLNSPTGTIVANAAMVGAGTAGEVAVYPTNDTNLIIDIDGYYAPPSSAPGGLSLYTLTPCRVLDTRLTTGAFSGTLAVDAVQSPCSIPSLAQALVLNATVVPSGPMEYLTLWPNGQPQPLASTLNAVDGVITSNLAVVPSSNGFVNAYAASSTQLVLDVFSYFALPSAMGGNYTFSINGFDSAGPVMMIGSFVANGNGNISGVFDWNSAGHIPRANVSFQGTYSIQPSGLGTMTITPTLNPPFDLLVAISSTGDGRLALENESSNCGGKSGGCYLPNAWAAGAITRQNPADLSFQQFAGNFASGFSGVDPTLGRYAGAGMYQIGLTGNLQGTLDTNDAGILTNSLPTAGTLFAPDPSTGRGTAKFVTSGITSNWVYYVTSAGQLNFLSIDPIGSPANLLQQTMLRQDSASYSNASLNGVSVFRTSGIAQSQDKSKRRAPGSVVPDVVLGLLTTDGAGNGSISYDENKGGTLTQQQTAQGTYSVASSGRVTLTGFGSGTPPIFYLAGENKAFVVGQDAAVAAGYFSPQSSGPFYNNSAVGNYWGGSYMPATVGVPDSVTSVFSDGNGNLSGTTNASGPAGVGTQSINATYQVDSTGRAVVSESGSATAILYVISPTKVALLPTTDINPAFSVLGSTN
jgi:hypothetical protein